MLKTSCRVLARELTSERCRRSWQVPRTEAASSTPVSGDWSEKVLHLALRVPARLVRPRSRAYYPLGSHLIIYSLIRVEPAKSKNGLSYLKCLRLCLVHRITCLSSKPRGGTCRRQLHSQHFNSFSSSGAPPTLYPFKTWQEDRSCQGAFHPHRASRSCCKTDHSPSNCNPGMNRIVEQVLRKSWTTAVHADTSAISVV